MPSDAKSRQWFIRITDGWKSIEEKVKTLQTWLDLEYYAIGYHTGSKSKKEHAHIAVSLHKVLQKQSLDTRFKKLFNVKGPNYSSKLWDGSDKVLSYLYHDKSGKIELFKLELSDDRQEKIKNTVELYTDIVKTAKEKSSKKIVDNVLEEIKESGKKWTEPMIAEHIYQAISVGKYHNPGIFQMERYVEEIMLRQDPGGPIIKYMVDALMRKMMH